LDFAGRAVRFAAALFFGGDFAALAGGACMTTGRAGTWNIACSRAAAAAARCAARALVVTSDAVGRFRSAAGRFTQQLITLVLRHLAAAHHELHEIARAFHREPRQAGGGADHVLHGYCDFAPGLEADFLRAFRELGDRIARIDSAMPGSALHHNCGGSGRPGLGNDWLNFLGHFGSGVGSGRKRGGENKASRTQPLASGKYMIQRKLCKRASRGGRTGYCRRKTRQSGQASSAVRSHFRSLFGYHRNIIATLWDHYR
jgi:hypothetical protein